MRGAMSVLGTVKSLKVGVHQGLELSLLLFIIVLQALSRKFHSEVPWEDLVIITESLEECLCCLC